jgi:hypothetical protein
MYFDSNLAHWVCLLAGLYLVLTGFLLRDIAREHSAMTVAPGMRGRRQGRAAAIGRRAVMIAVGLAAAIYGVSRLVN